MCSHPWILLLLLCTVEPGCLARKAAISGAGAAPDRTSWPRVLRRLRTAEARVLRHPRALKAWLALREACAKAHLPGLYLSRLESAEAAGRLPRQLRPDLARGLRRRAATLATMGAASAALRALFRADSLARPPAAQGAELAELRDRLLLAKADRLLRGGNLAGARAIYRDLATRAALVGPALAWRRAAAGESHTRGSLAAALMRLGDSAPELSARLARGYLEVGGRRPEPLLAALGAAALAGNRRLLDLLDLRLSRVAPMGILTSACALRRRPGTPCCEQLRHWATSNLDALRRWAELCRSLGWRPGDLPWLRHALRLLAPTDSLGLGPLEGLLGTELARKAASVWPLSTPLRRLAGLARASATGTDPRKPAPQGLPAPGPAGLAFEAWASGNLPRARRLLSLAVQAERRSRGSLWRRWKVLARLTRLVRGHRAELRLLERLATSSPRLRKGALRWLLHRGDLAAALHLAGPDQVGLVTARLRRLGNTLGRWSLDGDRSILRRWTSRQGLPAAKRAWAQVALGISGAGARRSASLELTLERAASGRAKASDALFEHIFRAGASRPQPWRTLHPRDVVWWAWLALVRGNRSAAVGRLRLLLFRSPGGVAHLEVVMQGLARLGLGREAGRLADELYERSLEDPALLRLVVLGATIAGHPAKAELALTDWASSAGRPDRIYLEGAGWAAARGDHRRAAAMAAKAVAWSGSLPLRAGLAALGHQWQAGRRREARRTAAWLLARFPKGDARDSVSVAVASLLLGLGAERVGRSYLPMARAFPPRSLWRDRPQELLRRATRLIRSEPLSERWLALAALAAASLHRQATADRHLSRLGRLSPSAELLPRALVLAGRGKPSSAIALLALLTTGASSTRGPEVRRLLWLGASLAARGGRRRLAARLASLAALRAPSSSATPPRDIHRMTELARGRLLPLEIPWDMLGTESRRQKQ